MAKIGTDMINLILVNMEEGVGRGSGDGCKSVYSAA